MNIFKRYYALLFSFLHILCIPSLSGALDYPIGKILEGPIDKKTGEKDIRELIGYLERSKFKGENTLNLANLSKAFLLYKSGQYAQAVQISRSFSELDIDDLRLFILADSYRLLWEEQKPESDQKKNLLYIMNSIRNYKRLILDYRNGPFLKAAENGLVKSRINLADHYYANRNFDDAIKSYLRLTVNYKKFLVSDDLQRIYFRLGESYYSKKLLPEARKAYLEVKKGGENAKTIERKVAYIDSMLNPPYEAKAQAPQKPSRKESLRIGLDYGDLDLPKSNEERAFQKGKDDYDGGRFPEAIRGLAVLAKDFPGSPFLGRAQALIIESLNSIINEARSRIPWGSHYKSSLLDARTLNSLFSWDKDTLIKASSLFYRSEFLPDAERILLHLVKDYRFDEHIPTAYLILSRIQRIRGDHESAVKSLQTINQKYGSSPLSQYALFKIALIYYEKRDFQKALSYFSLYTKNDADKKPEGLWWTAKTHEMLGNIEKTKELHELLRRHMPLSFYAVIENSYGHILTLASSSYGDPISEASRISSLLSIDEQIHFARAFDFISIGLFDYGVHELELIGASKDAETALFMAWLFKDMGLSRKSIKSATQALEKNPDALDTNLISLLFPKNHMKILVEKGRLYGIDHLLLLSLIKQESAFDDEAVSRSGARGLMQLMPFTANEVSTKLLLSREIPVENLYLPEINVALGTFYLHNLLRINEGNLIHALASYNAGPSRFREWKSQNAGLSLMEFIEQIPVSETNGYVKSILRNYILYSYIIDKRIVSLNEITNAKFNLSVRVTP